MPDGIVTLPRAGTVEIIQEFGTAPAAPARPTLSPVVIGSSYQIVEQGFAGFYQAKFEVLDEPVGTGNGVTLQYTLKKTPVLKETLVLNVHNNPSGTHMTRVTHYDVKENGEVTLTPAGVALLGSYPLTGTYFYAPATVIPYPGIKQGAEVLSPSTEVAVFLKTVEDIFDITTGFGVTVSSTSVTVPGNIEPSHEVTTIHGQVSILAATTTIVDTSIDFFALGVRAGDVLRFITSAVDLERTDSIVATNTAEHVILSIPSTNSVTFEGSVASQGGKVEYEIIRKGSQSGEILITYRARRRDLENQLLEFESTTAIEESLGPIQQDNPLAYGLSKCIGATDKTIFGVMVADQDNLVDHQKALDFLEGEEVYMMVPLTNNAAIHQVYVQHCENLSDSASMRERRVLVTTKGLTRRVYQAQSDTGEMSVNSQIFTDPNAKFVTNGVPIGSVLRLVSPETIELAESERDELIISGINSETEVVVIQAVTHGTDIVGEAVGTGNGAQLLFQLDHTENVIPTSAVVYLNGVQQEATDYSVSAAGQIGFVMPPGLGVSITADYEIATLDGIQYTVESQELTNFEIAKDVSAVGEGYGSRRVTVTHAELVTDDAGVDVEPYFLNCAVAGLVSALAPNQPIANVPVPGFTTVKHIRKFTETHFGMMAAGGVSVYIQDRDTSPIVMRNWITTDTLNVNTRECSIVNMVDFYAKFLRNNIKAIAGRFNITEDFIDNMLRPGINGVNRELITAGFIGPKTQIISIEQSTVEKDQLFVLEEVEFFAPANRIVITVRVI